MSSTNPTSSASTIASLCAESDTRGSATVVPALTVEDLDVTFSRGDERTHVVRSMSFDLARGGSLGILGESGSGKSVTMKSLMGILPAKKTSITARRAALGDTELLGLHGRERGRVIGSRIAMIFQDALSSLNPVQPVGKQIAEMYRVHQGLSRRDAKQAAIRMMKRVAIPDAARRAESYPHEFSGGMRQRVCIAVALSLDPEVLIADEPTTALDVTVQEQILELLRAEQAERGMSLIMISHDISVVSEMTEDVIVMYAGRKIESGPTSEVIANPGHPYTQGLAAASVGVSRGERMRTIPGLPPDLTALPPGCSFAPRCALAQDICRETRPELELIGAERHSACHFSQEVLNDDRGL